MMTLIFVLTLVVQTASPATPAHVRTLFEAGKFKEVVDLVPPSTTDARLLYLAAESRQKLGDADGARSMRQQLADRGTNDPWGLIGRSALAVDARQLDEALAAANDAVNADPALAEAHYQLGLVLALRENFGEAAAAFDKAGQLDPAAAYPRYYAGLSYYKAKRVDLMAARFEAFLKLAPQAPERPEVESIMRTIRGR